MQRRAAALYGAFFLVLAVGAYGMIAVASPPTVSIEDPDHQLGDGDELTVDGRTYDVGVSDGRASLSWTDPDATYTATWAEGDQVMLGGVNYTVAIEMDTDPPQLRLTELRPLPEDVQTTEVNGTEYVIVEEDGSRELVEVDTYLDQTQGEAAIRIIRAGDSIDYRGNQTTVDPIEDGSATLSWQAPRTITETAAEGDVLNLNGVEFVAHFPTDSTLVLDRDVEAYEQELEVQATYDERINGLWGVTILSGLGVVVLLGLAYLPSRY